MKKQALNPYLPSWEYTPDCEPHVFGDKVYVYGSHDQFNGKDYCLNDYVCWSAPVDDLSDWRYEGVIFRKDQEPGNEDGHGKLFAPDVAQGPDGRYYLFYVIHCQTLVSVAVCDTPAGQYEFYGHVHYADGTRLGEREGDEHQFDPGVFVEGDTCYLYTGFCMRGNKESHGAMATVLGSDMLTIKEAPVLILPGIEYTTGGKYAGHEYFEAPSLRKIEDTYYFIYSSIVNYELCYATSKCPTKDFVYQGVIVTNNDMHIDTYKPAEQPAFYGGNDHGSIVEINGQWYVFHHRHTNGTNFSRQDCIEKITVLEDGSIPQVEMTSCGANDGPLKGDREYPAYIACNLWCKEEAVYTGWSEMGPQFPKLTQDGVDGDEVEGFIDNMQDGATAGFKYFECKGVRAFAVKVRGAGTGVFELRTKMNGDVIASIPVQPSTDWTSFETEVSLPDGVYPIYLSYAGDKEISLGSFTFIQ